MKPKFLDHSSLKRMSENGGHKLVKRDEKGEEGTIIRVAQTNTPGWYFSYTKGWKRLHY